jgi:hypothetical protein
MAQFHTVKFKQNTRTLYYLGECTCGWSHLAKTLLECQTRAAGHDLEWVDIPVEKEAARVES